ncbi:MAG: hypothetical protein JWN30_1146 [Bacilli bacterium]|nr:hypothetical protein [Bacilli bacterium]
MHNKLRLAVVGLGRVANSHLPAIAEVQDQVELAALVSRDRQKALETGKQWNVDQIYTSYEEMLADPSIDAVLLLVPHDLHASYSIQALNAGKHVLIEKPMALNEAEAAAMVEAADENRVTLMVGQSRRFFEPVMESIRKIRAKEIGDIININALLLSFMDKPATAWWTDMSKIGGFIIPLWGSHILDYILWAYGELPQTVYAQGYSNNPNWQGEDEVSISLQFSKKRMANVLMSFNAGSRPTDEEGLTGKRIWSTQNSIYDRYVIGTNGLLTLKDEYELLQNSEKVECAVPNKSNFAWQIEEFAESIRQKRAPLASGQEILQLMKVIDACFASIKDNRIIELL